MELITIDIETKSDKDIMKSGVYLVTEPSEDAQRDASGRDPARAAAGEGERPRRPRQEEEQRKDEVVVVEANPVHMRHLVGEEASSLSGSDKSPCLEEI